MSERTIRNRVRERILPGTQPSMRERELAIRLLWLHVLAMLVVFLPGVSTIVPLRAALVFLTVTFVPGTLLLLVFGEFQIELNRLLYAAGASLVLVMGMGVVLNLLLPAFGLMEPMSRHWLAVGLTGLNGALGVIALRRTRTRTRELHLLPAVGRITPRVLVFLLFLPLTVISIWVLKDAEMNLPIVLVLTGIALVPLGLVLARGTDWFALGIWGIAVALLYHATLSGEAYGGSSIPMHIIDVGRWTPGVFTDAETTTSLVANGVLYPTYAILNDIPLYIQSTYANPLLVSLLPVILFQMYRTYVSDRTAFLGASIFVFSHPFYRLYPGGGRVATPVIFLALIGLLITDDKLTPLIRKLLASLFTLGLVVSHYGTSYFGMIALVGAFLVLLALRLIDRGVGQLPERWAGAIRSRIQLRTESTRPAVITASFVGFVAAAVLGWYLYTSGGNHFSLPKHVYWTLHSLFEGNLFGGSSANRAQKSYGYGTESIRYARLIYFGLAGLMGVGLLTETYRRLRPDLDTLFDDEYLAVAGLFLGTFGSTLIFSTGWGGGRPMMIGFTFTAVFAVVGFVVPATGLWTRVRARLGSERWPTPERVARIGKAGIAVILALFLILNTGVAAATVLGGAAPYNVPRQHEFQQMENPTFNSRAFIETDVQTHAWYLDHRAGGYPVWGDVIANGESDKYRSSIALAMEKDVTFPYSTHKPQGNLYKLEQRGIEPGHVLLLGHNLDLGVYTANSSYSRFSLQPFENEWEQRNRIYSTPSSQILFAKNRTSYQRLLRNNQSMSS